MRRLLVILIALAALLVPAAVARADGDPGSDVLVYQDLYPGTVAGLTPAQQARISTTLQQAAKAGFGVRVAIIGGPADLGSVTGAWHQPQAYAQFLAEELKLAYDRPVLVVMPNGIGIEDLSAPGAVPTAEKVLARIHPGSGAAALTAGTISAIRTLAHAAGDTLGSASPGTSTAAGLTSSSIAPISGQSAQPLSVTSSGAVKHGADTTVALVALILVLLAGAALGGRVLWRRRQSGAAPALPFRVPILPAGTIAVAAVLIVVVLAAGSGSSSHKVSALTTNPHIDPGTVRTGPAPGFQLTDETGRPVSLSQYRGKAVLLAFLDSECTTVCPLESTAMLDAQTMLGAAGKQVQLLGVDANPDAISLEDVASYTELHGLSGRWHFLTGTEQQLSKVWKDYGVQADIEAGLIEHTPALVLISPQGVEKRVFVTQDNYAAVPQFGQVLARDIARVLPGHPAVHSNLSYRPVAAIGPEKTARLPRAGGGSVTIGPGKPHLQVFFASWAQEVTSLAGHLSQLNAYAAEAKRTGLPQLSGVDEGSVEPSAAALPDFLKTLKTPLTYPVAIDGTGRVADGYEVQGQPWFVLTSATGKILWYQEVDTKGWPTEQGLVQDVRSALKNAPNVATSRAAALRQLAGSPPPLAALHAQAARLVGGNSALMAKVRALRGHPIVINEWESYCAPCQAEFGLFADASAADGKRVAFLGADNSDSASSAQQFLDQHPVSYPSYSTTLGDLSSLAVVAGAPNTIFVNSAGKVVFVHNGEYDSLGTLEQDIATYAH